MFDEKLTLISQGKLIAYENDKVVLKPPCYNEQIFNIYNSYVHTGYSKNHEKPLEKLQTDFPSINEEDLLTLIDYFKMVDSYCELVCCAFAGIYQTVGVPETVEAQRDKQRIVNICLTRFPWLKSEYIENLLAGVCHMCNR